jgi:hypothetical protein
MSMLMAKLHYFRLPMACLWDTLYMDSHKHAHYMYQHSVICSRTCLWPNCIIFVRLWRAYETPYIGILLSTPSICIPTFCNMLMSRLMAKLHSFLVRMASLWDTLYRDSHKHAQYMYQHSVICSWVCLWPNCIIFVCLWRAYEIPYIGIHISTPSICTNIL